MTASGVIARSVSDEAISADSDANVAGCLNYSAASRRLPMPSSGFARATGLTVGGNDVGVVQ